MPRSAAPTPLSRAAPCVRVRDELDRAALAARCADEARMQVHDGATNALLPPHHHPRTMWHDVGRTAIHWWVDGAWRQAETAGAPATSADAPCVWRGWCARTAAPVEDVHRPASWAPWHALCRADDAHAHVLRWYCGGATNAGFNELDRGLLRDDGMGDDDAAAATSFVLDDDATPAAQARLSRGDLLALACRAARGLAASSVDKGDRVLLMTDTGFAGAALASACKRRGVVYSTVVVDAGDAAVCYRVRTLRPKMVVLDDAAVDDAAPDARATALAAAEECNADEEVASGEAGRCCVVTWSQLTSRAGLAESHAVVVPSSPAQRVRRVWAEDEAHRPVPVEASFPLFVLFTSGSTGKPKGITHVHGGYIVGLRVTSELVLGIDKTASSSSGGDGIFIAASPGWITGQSYMISAALLHARPSILMRGSMVSPPTRFANIIERNRVAVFKAGSTFLRVIMALPDAAHRLSKHDLTSLRRAAACAEPVNDSVHRFAMKNICARYMNAYWSTEHGGIVCGNVYATQRIRPAHTLALPWIQAGVDDAGDLLLRNRPPHMALTVWLTAGWCGDAASKGACAWSGDAARWASYFTSDGSYKQGDAASIDDDGWIALGGRSDDVCNVGGIRISTAEMESALLRAVSDKDDGYGIQNLVVAGVPHDTLGTVPLACIVMQRPNDQLPSSHRAALVDMVRRATQPCAGSMQFATVLALPETFSGKYVRRMLTAIRSGDPLGDLSSLKNPDCIEPLRRALAPGGGAVEVGDASTTDLSARSHSDDARARIVSAVPALAIADEDTPLLELIDSFDAINLATVADGLDPTELGSLTLSEVLQSMASSSSSSSERCVQPGAAASSRRLSLSRGGRVVQFPGLDGSSAKFAALEPWWRSAGYTCETVDILIYPACASVAELADHVAAALRASEATDGDIRCMASYSNGCFLAKAVVARMARDAARPLPAQVFIDPLLHYSSPPLTRAGMRLRTASIIARAVARNPDDSTDETLALAARDPDALRAQVVARMPQLRPRFESMDRWTTMLCSPLEDATTSPEPGLRDASMLFVWTTRCLFGKTADERLASWRPQLGASAPEPLSITLGGDHFQVVSDPQLGLVCSLFLRAVDQEDRAMLQTLRSGQEAARAAHAGVRAATDNIRHRFLSNSD